MTLHSDGNPPVKLAEPLRHCGQEAASNVDRRSAGHPDPMTAAVKTPGITRVGLESV
jgi:hypothetical protein